MSKESKKKEVALKKEVEQRRIYEYWMSAFERAGKKMPVKEWEVAEKRYTADKTGDDQKAPVVNDLRNHIEVSRAYLDQRDPAFKVMVAPAYANDKDAKGQAECERAYLKFVWAEQDCQIAEAQKLDSALIRNVGFTMPIFDMKKWMPGLRYLPAREVRLDPDCGGIMARASWVAYREDISVEQLKADVPDITPEEILRVKASVLTTEEQEEVEEGEKELYLSVRRWHVFARNDAAVRDFTKELDEPEKVESLVDELKLTTERRYLQFVEGIPRPVKDAKKWPFDLDHNEFPITPFMLNQVPEDLYGFTDYQQMERMDLMSDLVMQWIEEDANYAAIRKYVGPPDTGSVSKNDIENFLNSNKRAYLASLVGEDGKELIREIRVGQMNPEMAEVYKMMHEQAIRASADSELAIESVESYKDVTAMGVRADMERRHQRNNLRLSGPRGYEKSIQQDAIKILEIAHQFVPRYSVVDWGTVDEEGEPNLESLNWTAALTAMLPEKDEEGDVIVDGRKPATLLKLGIDAIVGDELSQSWKTSDELPMVAIRLSTKVHITPGSTRNLTQAQQAAELTQFYSEVLYPTIYEPMGLFDKAAEFIKHIATFMQGMDRMDDFLPTTDEVKQFLQQQQQAAEQEAQAEREKAELEMQMSQAKGENEQRSAELQIGTDAAKAQIEIERDLQKTANEERKAKLQLAQAKNKESA